MPKYAPLGDFLRKQRSAQVPMTFAQIERVIGAKLPPSQYQRAWWSNNPWNNVMTKVWLDAGFVTEQVDVEGRKLVFRRAAKGCTVCLRSPSAVRGAQGPGAHSGGNRSDRAC